MIKNIIFDFDGVILDSVPVKTEAFRKLFNNFMKEDIELLIDYHLINGGVSRYEKIRYFFESILSQSITEEQILKYAKKYSELTKKELSNSKYLISDTFNFIQKNYKKYNMHIVSGADESDLQYICSKLNLTEYFLSINGSPKIKSEIVKDILLKYNYKNKENILIGDSINDYYASINNSIGFYGFNNESLREYGNYINNFSNILIEQGLNNINE